MKWALATLALIFAAAIASTYLRDEPLEREWERYDARWRRRYE